MRLKNWDKGEVHQAFPQVCVVYTLTVYFKTLHCVYPAEKSH